MTEKEAIRILDPETTREALFGTGKEEGIKLVEEACRVAVKAMKKQEPKEVVYHDNCDNHTASARCPRCFEIISNDYCGYCGQRVK